MKNWLVLSLVCAALVLTGCDGFGPVSRSKLPWMTDYVAARAKAREEKKLLLINFTGSDWCGWCKRLQKEVFSKPMFAEYAKARLILLEIDFPRNKSQRPETMRANEALSQQFRVQGFPTIFLLDSEGRILGSTGYLPGGPEPFIRELKRLATSASERTHTTNKAELRLGGISGPAGNRLALINNTTLAAGEAGSVRTAQGRVQIRCIAILERSVVVSVEGRSEPVELYLSGRL